MSFRGKKEPLCDTSRGSRANAPARAGSLLVALLALFLLACAAVGETPVVSVDFAAPVTGIKPMTGILHGFGSSPAADPSNSFIAPLSPSLWRAANQSNALYDRITGFGARFEFVTSDVYGYPKASNAIYLPGRNSSGATTDWAAYDAFLDNQLNIAQANGHIMIWEFWNEPDLTFNDPTKTGSATPGVSWPATQPQFFAAFARFSAAVRARFPSAQYPNVLIAGPSPSSFDPVFLQAFFDYCKDHSVEVNVAAWHEFSADLRLVPGNIGGIRANFLNNPAYAALKLKEIHINEFLSGGADQCSPASLLANLYYFEDPQANPDGVCKTCWNTLSSPVLNSCFMTPGTLGDMLSRDGTQPLAIWWAYQRYAASVGSRVASTTTDSHVLPVASRIGPQSNTAQVLVTDYPFQETPPATNAILNLTGLSSGGPPPAPVQSGLALWLDASSFQTAGFVSTWTDQSPNGRNLTAPASTGNQPSVVLNAINGLSVVRFDGNDVIANSYNFGNSYSIFTVSRMEGSQNNRLITSTATNWLLGYWSGRKDVMYAGGWVKLDPNQAPDTGVHFYGATGTEGGPTNFYDGASLLASSSGGTIGPNGLSLGASLNNPASEASKGDIAEVLMYDHALSATDRAAVVAYLTAKWGVGGGGGGGSSPLPFLAGATRVHVRLEKIPNTVEAGLPALPVVSELDLPISSAGTATLTLPGMAPHEVWAVTLSAPVSAVQPAPPTPGGFTAGASDGQIALNWNAVPGAASYTVTRSAGPGLPPSVTFAGLAASTFTDLSLTDGQTYYYKVAANSSSGSSSAPSGEVSATPPIPASTASSYQLNCGASGAASPFGADAFFFGNYNTRVQTFATNLTYATNPAPPAVYNSQRNGLLAYVFPNLTPGAPYTLRLHFAETNSTATSGQPSTPAGYRVFNVSVNGAAVLTNFDIAGSAIAAGATNGYGVAIVREFPVNADANGRLHVHLSGVVRRAQINGIEVLPLPATVPAVPTGFLGTALPGGDVLTWNAVPGATSYQIYRSTTPGGTGTLYKTVTGTAVANPDSTGGFYYYRIAALNATGPSALTADIFATLDLAAWKSVRFTSAELQNPLVSGDTATPAGDGLKNLLKYALGLDPHQGAAAPVAHGTTVVGGQTYLTLSYNRSKRASGIQSYVETCSDLTSWAWGPGAAVVTATADQGETERLTWRDTTPITPANPQRFIRLRVAGQ